MAAVALQGGRRRGCELGSRRAVEGAIGASARTGYEAVGAPLARHTPSGRIQLLVRGGLGRPRVVAGQLMRVDAGALEPPESTAPT